MSRIIAYRRFLEVRVEDDAGAPLKSFGIVPTPATRHCMARHRLASRPRPAGLATFYSLDPDSRPALIGQIDERIRLSFAMYLKDPGLFRLHHPDLTSASGPALHFDNLDEDGGILGDGEPLSAAERASAEDGVTIVPLRLAVRLDLSGSDPTAIEVRDPISDDELASVPVQAPPGTGALSVTLDLTGTDGGLARLREVPPGPLEGRIFLDDWAFATGATGMIELWWETAQTAVPADTGVVYRIQFERRAA